MVAAGGGDSSREEGHIERMRLAKGLGHRPDGLDKKDKGYSRQSLVFSSRQRTNVITGGTMGDND